MSNKRHLSIHLDLSISCVCHFYFNIYCRNCFTVFIKWHIFIEICLCIKDILNFLLLIYTSGYQKSQENICSIMNWWLHLKMCIKCITFCYFCLWSSFGPEIPTNYTLNFCLMTLYIFFDSVYTQKPGTKTRPRSTSCLIHPKLCWQEWTKSTTVRWEQMLILWHLHAVSYFN